MTEAQSWTCPTTPRQEEELSPAALVFPGHPFCSRTALLPFSVILPLPLAGEALGLPRSLPGWGSLSFWGCGGARVGPGSGLMPARATLPALCTWAVSRRMGWPGRPSSCIGAPSRTWRVAETPQSRARREKTKACRDRIRVASSPVGVHIDARRAGTRCTFSSWTFSRLGFLTGVTEVG